MVDTYQRASSCLVFDSTVREAEKYYSSLFTILFLVFNFEVLCPCITQLSQIKATVFLNGYNEYYAFKHFYSEDLVVLFAMTFFKYQLTI